LWNRVKHKDTRPLLKTEDPFATLSEIYEKRAPIYAMADLTVPVEPSYSIEMTRDKVVEALVTRPDVLEMPK
ncbi:MAG: shikimate kinase, partial [Pseudomonadota bacterium]|nr:shikimate kinase [Pseudomonadota bacterium]